MHDPAWHDIFNVYPEPFAFIVLCVQRLRLKDNFGQQMTHCNQKNVDLNDYLWQNLWSKFSKKKIDLVLELSSK